MKDHPDAVDKSQSRETEIRKLLEEFNYWEQAVRHRANERGRMGSTGEANARIALLKKRLIDEGAVFRRHQGQYILDGIVSPGQGREEPE